MSRPIKIRNVQSIPETTNLIPEGKKKCSTHFNNLKIEEFEAIRLKDFEDFSQEEAAEKMDVSRQTFQKILNSARKKIAESLIYGHGISIGGGDFKTPNCKFHCNHCSIEYIPTFNSDLNSCPNCLSEDVICIKIKKKCTKLCHLKK